MQATSETWETLLADDETVLETKAIINGAEYTEISAPLIMRGMVQDSLSIGNAVSANLQFSLLSNDTIPKSAKVEIKQRLVGFDGTTSEWLDAGTFYISHRQRDAISGLMTFDCYDALLKANAEYQESNSRWVTDQGNPIVTDEGKRIIFSRTGKSMLETVQGIAQYIGVQIDPRTVIKSGEGYVVAPSSTTLTMRDVLCGIAAVHGGNWIITPENKLRLVPIALDASEIDPEDIPTTRAVLGSLHTDDEQTITGLRVIGDEETIYGTYEGAIIDVNTPYLTEDMLVELLGSIVGTKYQPFEMVQGIYDPALELGDYIKIYDDVISPIYSETANLAPMFTGNLSAPPANELADEYPYMTSSKRVLNEAISYTDELDESLNQEGVFNRLTNNGEARGIYKLGNELYINATYIHTGTLAADRIAAGTITLSKLDSEVTDAISEAQSTADSANGREQTIYISKASATTSVNANTTWVTNVTGNQNTWTAKRPQYNSSYPVLFVATQRQTVEQMTTTTCTCTTPVVDDTTTVIDGGHIITGTVDAGAINAQSGTFNVANIPDLSADKITTGTLKSTGTAGGDNNFSLNLNTALMQMISQLDSTLNVYRRIALNAATNRINFGYKAASDNSFTDFAHIAASMTGNGFPMLDITSDNTNCSVRFGRLISGAMSRGITVPMDNAPGSKHVQVTGGLDIDGVDVMTLPLAQYFTVLGKFVYSKTTGDTEGAGKAQIQIIGKSVVVDFSVKIDKPGTGSMADVGIKISGTNSLKSLNSNIPDFTAAAGGVITFYDADGKYSSMNGYAGTGLLDTSDYNRWNFGRMYDTSGSIGAWADSRFVTDLVITGRLLGTLT